MLSLFLFVIDCSATAQYSVSKSKILLGFADQGWEEHIVGEIDSALNQFIECVPDHRT